MMSLLLGSVSSSALMGIFIVEVSRISKFTIVEKSPELQVSRISKFTLAKRAQSLYVNRISKFTLVKPV